MSSEYAPDLWTVLEITNKEGERHWRVFASWTGSYLGSAAWKMSSGITRIEDGDELWRVHNDSGSIYLCHKRTVGMTGYSSGVLHAYQQQASAAGASIKELGSLADVMVPVNAALLERLRMRVGGVQVDPQERLPLQDE